MLKLDSAGPTLLPHRMRALPAENYAVVFADVCLMNAGLIDLIASNFHVRPKPGVALPVGTAQLNTFPATLPTKY